jgi:hypothetical protein
MGLDMYLNGEKYFFAYPPEEARIRHEDGFEVRSHTLRLGYWRKHPNLHGYIVNTFADGEDNCQPIMLDENDIEKIIAAITAQTLPHTEGFFFGASDGSEKDDDLKILTAALNWRRSPEQGVWRSIHYQASW